MPNNDYILRSDVLEAMCEECDDPIGCDPKHKDRGCYMKMAVNAIPAADVEPVRHGYWYFRGGRPCCSVCNTKALWKDEGGTGGFSHEYVGAKSKRCPECGARMDKEAGNAEHI